MMQKLVLTALIITTLPVLGLAQVNSCPLVSRQSYDELFKAVDTLGKDLRKNLDGCKEQSSDMQSMLMAQEQLRSSTTRLHQYWQDPTLAAHDSAAFADTLSRAIGSVNSIGESIGNSSIFKSGCGGEKPNAGRILIALNDVVTNLAPLALLAGTLTGGVAQAVPYVLTVAGVSSIVKLLSTEDKDKPDMTKEENRELVQRAACEYTRIQQRVRYLTLMQKGEIETLKAELEKKSSELKKSLALHPKVLSTFTDFENKTSKIEDNWKKLNHFQEQFRRDSTDFVSLGDDIDLRCGFLKSFVNSKNESQYPLGILSQLQELGITPNNNRRAAIFDAYVSVDGQVRTKLPEILSNKIKKEECAQLAVKWLTNIGRLLDESSQSLRDNQENLRQQLNRDSQYSEWSQKMSEVEGQKILLEKMLQFMGASQNASAVVDRSELNQRINSLKNILFGSGSLVNRYNPFGSKSQVAAWLDRMKDLYEDRIEEFNKGYNTLDANSREIVRLLAPEKRPPSNKVSNYMNLALITSEAYPKDSIGWERTCQHLEDIWVNWSISQDYLSTIELFCGVIAESIRNHQDLDPAIVSMCAGKVRLDGTYAEEPGYVKLQKSQIDGEDPSAYRHIKGPVRIFGTYERSQLVRNKQRELLCTISIPK